MDNYNDYFDKINNFITKNKPIGKEVFECCDKTMIIVDNIDLTKICLNCGYCHSKNNNNIISNEDNAFNENTHRENLGNLLLPKSSMITNIVGSNKFNHIKQLHLYHRPTEERGLVDVFNKIDKILQKLNLPPKISFNAKYYYKELCEDNEDGSLTRGDIRSGIIVACIYISCKNNNKPLRIDELSTLCNVDKTTITRGLKRITEIEKNKNIKINENIDNIHEYLEKYSKKLEIFTPEDIEIIHLLYERSIRLKIIKNNTYRTICAGIIFLYIKHKDLKIKKKKIVEIIDISEVTLNKIFKEYEEYKKILFIGL